MEEIFALSDAITVFKDGRYVRTFDNMQEVNHDALVQAMVGRELGDIYGWQPREYGKERLRLEQVKAPGVRQPVSLSVRSGEIVGLFGLVGAGRSELMKGLFGGSRITGGRVYIDGEAIDIRKPAQAIQAGMMLCPEDRKAEGLFRSLGARQHQYQRSPQAYSRRLRYQQRLGSAERRPAYQIAEYQNARRRAADYEPLRRQSAEGDPRPLAVGRDESHPA